MVAPPLISLHRTTDDPPLALLRRGPRGQDTFLFPWEELLALREVVSGVTPDMAGKIGAFPFTRQGPWGVEPSQLGISLLYPGQSHLLSAEEWARLREILFVGEDLLSQVEVAKITGRLQPRVAEAIATGRLFALRVPGLKVRQWRIPRRAAEEWARPKAGKD